MSAWADMSLMDVGAVTTPSARRYNVTYTPVASLAVDQGNIYLTKT